MQGSDRMIENKSGGALSPEGKHFGSLEKRALVQRWKDDKNSQSSNPRKWKKACIFKPAKQTWHHVTLDA